MQKPFIQSSCLFTNKECKRPFAKFEIDETDFLDSIQERGVCPKCFKSRKYFCYNCYVALDEVKDKVPRLKLPIQIDIIKHPSEVDGKCTSTHAAVLAPDEVKIFTFPDIPDYTDQNVVLVFPSKNAVPLLEYWQRYLEQNSQALTVEVDCKFVPLAYLPRNVPYSSCRVNSHSKRCCLRKNKSMENQAFEDLVHSAVLPFDKVVFIDSTWRQTKRLYGDERLKRLPCVVLDSHKSLFWRHQRDKPLSYLATIEAIYYFLVELHHLIHPGVPYSGQYDNMLFFFKYMYQKIRKVYDPRVLVQLQSEDMQEGVLD